MPTPMPTPAPMPWGRYGAELRRAKNAVQQSRESAELLGSGRVSGGLNGGGDHFGDSSAGSQLMRERQLTLVWNQPKTSGRPHLGFFHTSTCVVRGLIDEDTAAQTRAMQHGVSAARGARCCCG